MLELFKVIALQSYTHKNGNFRRKSGRLSLRNCPNLTLTFYSFARSLKFTYDIKFAMTSLTKIDKKAWY